MNTDMDLIKRWPQAVTLDMVIQYERGAPDRHTYCLKASERTSEVHVLIPQHSGAPLELQRIDWRALPGRSLYLRSLNVLAVHFFGAVAMPPRARGAPLWQYISVSMSDESDELPQIQFELETVDDLRAALRYRCHPTQPLVSRLLTLDVLDADPLRALLRIGIARVRPLLSHSSAPVRSVPNAPRTLGSSGVAQQV
ncbi:MAG: hypothetical protein CFE40_05130 [Burkholderiales bacterium PBB1]|nr:MAG: hypothetical protein CFE40_05130 [Burkholderiales bacterium PBB1]